MVFGNFGKKITEYNEKMRERNMQKLRLSAEKAEKENKKLQEEFKLRKKIEENKKLKQKVSDQRYKPVKDALKKIRSQPKTKKTKKDNYSQFFGENKGFKL